MIGVRQSRVHADDGDCLRACLASIFECELHEAPAAPAGEDDAEWKAFTDDVLAPWCADRGVWIFFGDVDATGFLHPDFHWIATTKRGPIGSHHSVVFRGRRCVWDPELGRATDRFGLEDVVQATYFIALDPAAFAGRVVTEAA